VKERELEASSIEEPTELELRRLRKAFRERIGKFDELLLSDVPRARQALRKLIPGQIQFLPEEREGAPQYHLRWALSVKPLIDGGYIGVASPQQRTMPQPQVRLEVRGGCWPLPGVHRLPRGWVPAALPA